MLTITQGHHHHLTPLSHHRVVDVGRLVLSVLQEGERLSVHRDLVEMSSGHSTYRQPGMVKFTQCEVRVSSTYLIHIAGLHSRLEMTGGEGERR